METHNIHTQGDVGMGIGVIVRLVVTTGGKEGDGALWV
jgi:hypothetical protein